MKRAASALIILAAWSLPCSAARAPAKLQCRAFLGGGRPYVTLAAEDSRRTTAFSPGGAFYAHQHGHDPHRVDVREVATGRLRHFFKLPGDFTIQSLSADGRWALVTTTNHGRPIILVFDVTSGAPALIFDVREFYKPSYEWLGRSMLQLNLGHGLHLYELKSRAQPKHLASPVPRAAHPEDQAHYLTSVDQRIVLSVRHGVLLPPRRLTDDGWRAFGWEPPQTLEEPGVVARPMYGETARLSASGRWLVMVGTQGRRNWLHGGNFESFVDVYDVTKGRLHRRFYVPDRQVTAAAFSPDESEVAWAGQGVLEVFDIETQDALFNDLRPNGAADAYVRDLSFVGPNKLIYKTATGLIRTVVFRE